MGADSVAGVKFKLTKAQAELVREFLEEKAQRRILTMVRLEIDLDAGKGTAVVQLDVNGWRKKEIASRSGQ